MKYDVIIVGAGPGGIFSAYELTKKNPELKVGVFEEGEEKMSHRRKECKSLHQLPDLRHHERLRRRRRVL